jgi:hypothetical protein
MYEGKHIHIALYYNNTHKYLGRMQVKLNALYILVLHENFPLTHLWIEPLTPTRASTAI